MVNEELKKWILSEEAQGYSEEQLKEYLVKQGYKQEEIDEAIKSINPNKKEKISFKKVLKPTPVKLFFPLLILILIFISYFINLSNLPQYGKFSCESSTLFRQRELIKTTFSEKLKEKDTNPQELILLLKEQEQIPKSTYSLEQFQIMKFIPLGNGLLYLSIMYDPFFPFPCELKSTGLNALDTNYCYYYMDKEDYNCITEKSSIVQPGGLFYLDLPPYKKISFFVLLIHSLILVFLLYFFISLLSYSNVNLISKPKKTKFLAILLGFLICLLLYFFSPLENEYKTIFFVYLMIIFSLYSIFLFIKKEEKRKIVSYILIGVFILILLAGFIFVNSLYDKNMPLTNTKKTSVEPEIVYCNNTQILTLEEKNQRGISRNYLEEEWKVCNNPSCDELCLAQSCEKYKNCVIFELRGDTPSCICTRYIKEQQ